MKLMITILLLVGQAQAATFTKRIDASSFNITGTFKKITFTKSPRSITGVCINNRAASEVVVNCTGTSTAAASTDTSDYPVAAGEAWCVDNADEGNWCWIKTQAGGTLSTGIVVLKVKGT